MGRLRSTLGGSLLFVLAMGVADRPALATPYDDGGTHTIAGADSDVVISNGTTVNVVSGANVMGMNNDPFAGPAISMSGSVSTLNVSGGSIAGGDGSYVGGSAVDAADGHFNFSGGSFLGGSSSGFFAYRIGGQGADIRSFQSLTVSGGTFTGGLGWPAGSGMRIGTSGMQATAYISGGDFSSGDSPYGYSFGDGLGIYNRPASGWSAVISGGTFHGGWGTPLHAGLHLANATVDATAGNAGATLLDSDSFIRISNTFYAGALMMYGSSHATLDGGYVDWPDFHDNSILDMNGGFMTAGGNVQDNAVVNVRGGHFGRLDSPDVFSQHSVLNVYGTGLTYQDNELHGFLQDGTPVDATIWLYDNAVINLFQVPEPSSAALAAIGLISLLALRHRRGKQ